MDIIKENELDLEELEKELDELRREKVFQLYKIDIHKAYNRNENMV